VIAANTHRFDPAARSRATALVVALLVLWPLLVWSQFHPASLFEARNLAAIAQFLGGFLPPDMSVEFLRYVMRSTVETVAIATAGMSLALLIAVPLPMANTRALSIARIGPGPSWRSSRVLHALSRGLLVSLRGVPELVWALVFVRALGLGPVAASVVAQTRLNSAAVVTMVIVFIVAPFVARNRRRAMPQRFGSG
jgi:phosphonate transport system permease protein